MRTSRLAVAVSSCVIALFVVVAPATIRAQTASLSKGSPLPPNATRCGPELPIKIELLPQSNAEAGKPVKFDVLVESSLDPDLVRDIRIEFAIPARVHRIPSAAESPLSKSGRSLLHLELVPADLAPYAIRARMIVQFMDGRRISRTATQWLNLGEDYRPEGMIGRIVDPDGTAIRVYHGVNVRN